MRRRSRGQVTPFVLQRAFSIFFFPWHLWADHSEVVCLAFAPPISCFVGQLLATANYLQGFSNSLLAIMCLVGQFALLLGTLFHYCLVGNVLPMICLVGNGFPYLPCWWLARLLFFALLACFSNYLLCRPIICLRVGMFFQWFAFLADYLPWWHVSSNYLPGFFQLFAFVTRLFHFLDGMFF